ncbi:MAG: hypothetical protein ACK40M_13550 [Flavobacteriales bacterium]
MKRAILTLLLTLLLVCAFSQFNLIGYSRENIIKGMKFYYPTRSCLLISNTDSLLYMKDGYFWCYHMFNNNSISLEADINTFDGMNSYVWEFHISSYFLRSDSDSTVGYTAIDHQNRRFVIDFFLTDDGAKLIVNQTPFCYKPKEPDWKSKNPVPGFQKLRKRNRKTGRNRPKEWRTIFYPPVPDARTVF